MKKIILFPLFLFLCQLLLVSCFGLKQDSSYISLLTVSNLDCKNCYEELSNIIDSIKGIKDAAFYLNEDETIMIITLEYDYDAININDIKATITSSGFKVDNFSN